MKHIMRLLSLLLACSMLLCGAAQAASYTRFLDAATAIYDGPGCEYDFVQYVGEDGIYTITRELENDYESWGKLKSGAGWVNLTEAAVKTNYTVEIPGWTPIFSAPGYDFPYVQTVGEDGVYTIVAERIDDEGNYWGKLKSGIGWVDFTYICTMGQPVLTASYADEKLLREGGYTYYTMDDSDYVTMLAFRAHEYLQDVKLFLVDYSGDEIFEEELHSFSRFFEDTPFVAGLLFQGDLNTYGISFTDESGEERTFIIYISGRNGSLVLEEYYD